MSGEATSNPKSSSNFFLTGDSDSRTNIVKTIQTSSGKVEAAFIYVHRDNLDFSSYKYCLDIVQWTIIILCNLPTLWIPH